VADPVVTAGIERLVRAELEARPGSAAAPAVAAKRVRK
jgi:hypothetical protein